MMVRALKIAGVESDFDSLIHGTRSVELAPADSRFNYRSPAYVPSGDWEFLAPVSGHGSGCSIGFFGFSDFAAKLKASDLDLSVSSGAPTPKMQTQVAKWLIPQLGPILSIAKNLKPLGLLRHAGGLPTTTIDANGFRTGLHLDSWFGEAIEGRDCRPGRLFFNLGPGCRYFYAVTPSVSSLAGGGLTHPSEVVFRILEESSQLRIARLSLPPGYGYIANTEDLIHDGSTSGSTSPSYSFTIMGNFQIEEFSDQSVFAFES